MEQEGAVAVPQNFGLQMARDPKAVLAEAKRAAEALTAIIKALPEDKKVMMGGEQYVEVDHWILVAAFYRCTPKIVSTEAIQYGDAKGFLARAIILDQDGREISAADAMCLDDEERWDVRPKYEWNDGKRVQVGTVPVPANQLRSMAQTRAVAKVCRTVFSWVVVLAGYAATPAEELTGHEKPSTRPAPQEPKPKTDLDAKLEFVDDLITKVDSKQVKCKDGTKTCYIVRTAGGKNLETWDEKLSNQAGEVAGTTTKAQLGYIDDKWGGKLRTFKALPAEAEA